MKNEKVLQMIREGQIEELQALLRDEIYAESLKALNGNDAKKRYTAMKNYFKYSSFSSRETTQKPCKFTFKGEEYTSFFNGYTIVLSKENSGDMEMFSDPENYFKVDKVLFGYEPQGEIDLNRIIAEARAEGYRLKKSETNPDTTIFYVHYKDYYYSIGLLDCTFSIINNGEKMGAYCDRNGILQLNNDIGIGLIMPIKVNSDDFTKNKIIIEAEVKA